MPLRNIVGIAALALSVGCARGPTEAPSGGKNTVGQIDRYLEKAVGLSNEGVVLMPSDAMARETDRTRLNEIAQALRIPFAACFLRRTIEVARVAEVEGAAALQGVPQGQLRLRARLNAAGEVLRAEEMEGTIEDTPLVTCIQEAVEAQEFPSVRSSTLRWLDVVYWVSLGYDRGRDSPERKRFHRRQVAEASRSAKACFQGRVREGRYEVQGVGLVDREGTSLINRIEPNELPPPVNRCVAQVFRGILAHADPESFVRAVIADVVFTVNQEGAVAFADEEWLRLMELEAAAIRRQRQRDEEEDPERPASTGGSVTISGVGVEPAPERPMDADVEGPRIESPAGTPLPPEDVTAP
ncbi:MAG: hypothetical protein ACPHRO_12095, partial [Nannocystaceae bacterium]